MALRPFCLSTVLLAGLGCLAAESTPIRQWRVAEFSFQAKETYQGTPLGVKFGATFTGPDGSVYQVPGFWDGGQTWRVRFAPTVPGEWSFVTTSTEEESHQFTEAYQGEVMHGNEPAQRVDVALDNAEEMRLVVNDGGDGTNYDHSDWADAELVRADGTTVYLDTIKPAFARQGHGELAFRTNIPGQPLRIADRTFEHGLGTHARSEIRYPLDGSFVRFRAWTGVDATVREHGSVRFEVLLSRRDKANIGRHDAGLHGQTGTFTALPAEGDNPLYRHGGFLRTSQNGHYLTYADGTPFFWLGDTWWFCPSDLVPIDGSSNPEIPSAFYDMVGVRKAQGFTTIHMAFLGSMDGTNPYTDAMRGPDLSPAYWQKVDRYLDYANANGLVPIIGMGWAGRPLTPPDWRLLWRHLIARYGAHAVTWLICGEYNVRGVSDELLADNLALGQFIKDTDPYHRAMTVHPWAMGGDRRQAWEQPWYDFIMFQGGHGPAPRTKTYLDAYARQPIRPVIEGECDYEGIHTFTDADIRNVAYRAIQSGACGYTYGSQGLWYPTQNEEDKKTEEWGTPLVWWKALRRPGAVHLGYLRQLYASLDWWKLQPAPDAVKLLPPADAANRAVVYDCVDHFAEATATNALWSRLYERDATCIELHPQGKDRTALAYPPIALPKVAADEKLLLVLAVGIGVEVNLHDDKHPADGVDFAVTVDGTTVWSIHRDDKPWLYQAIDLTAKAGQTVQLELVTGTGPDGNMNYDHGIFRQPAIIKVGAGDPEPRREAYLAPPAHPVFASADGDRTFVIYFPREPGPALRLLQGIAPKATYTATWHNPRTGESLAPTVLATTDTTLPLPEPPDTEDWVLVMQEAGQ